MLKHETSQLYS